ncbi:hypothetical protein VQ056_31645 [Paenibacillus sp. JTLBN-2024]
MYAVVLRFDQQTEQALKRIWEEMRDRGISGYVDEVPNRRPHLTLADYSNLDEAEFMDMFDRFYNARAGFSLNFGMLGTFIGSGTLFWPPIRPPSC